MPLQRENMKTLSRLMLANFINDLVLGGLIHFIFNSFGRSHCSSRMMSNPMNSTLGLSALASFKKAARVAGPLGDSTNGPFMKPNENASREIFF